MQYALVDEEDTMEYDGKLKTFVANVDTFEGRVEIDDNYTLPSANAGTYTINVTGKKTIDNYIIEGTTTTVEITKAQVKVIFPKEPNVSGLIEPSFENESGDSFNDIIKNPTIKYYKVKFVFPSEIEDMKASGNYVAAVNFDGTSNYELKKIPVVSDILDIVLGVFNIEGQPHIYIK